MHHQLPNRKRTLNLLLRRASGSGKISVLGQIEPQTPRLVVSFRQCLQVSVLQPYFPQNLKPFGFPGAANKYPLPGRYRLRRKIKRFLIIVYPCAVALDQLSSVCRPPSRREVLVGSSYFTCPPQIPPAARCHLRHAPVAGRNVVLCCAVQRLACGERSDLLKVTRRGATLGYEPFNCSNVREGYQ